MKTILNIIAMTTLLVTNVSAEVVTPYGVFNPLAMFDASADKKTPELNSAFYNYGNQGYDFVVNSTPVITPSLPTQLASLDR
jgi:hypothetical protein